MITLNSDRGCRFWPGLTRTAAVAVMLSLVALPAASRAESLPDAMVMAYNSNPELRSSGFAVTVLAEGIAQARAPGMPQVEGIISVTAVADDLKRIEVPTEFRLSLSQALHTGGQVENAMEAVKLRKDAGIARYGATEQSVLLDTVTAFMDVRVTDERITLAMNNIRVIGEVLEEAVARREVGLATNTDVAQAEARLAGARRALEEQRGARTRAGEAYRRVVGTLPGQLMSPPPLPPLPETRARALELATVNDPALRAAQLERKATGFDVRAAIGALLPQIELQAQAGYFDPIALGTDEEFNATIGVVVSIPFYRGGGAYSLVREQQAIIERQTAEIDIALRDIEQRVGVAWSDLLVARAQNASARVEIVAAEAAYRQLVDEAQAGLRTILDVLDAEQGLLDARQSLVDAERDEYVGAYALLASVGLLTVDHLGLETDPPVYDGAVLEAWVRLFGFEPSDDTVWSLSYRP